MTILVIIRVNTIKLEEFCSRNKIEFIGKISYDDKVPICLSDKSFIIDDPESKAGEEIINIWKSFDKYLYS